MRILSDLFFQQALRSPDKTALWCGGESIAYGALARMTSQYANHMLSLGIGHGEHIGIPMNNSIASVALIFAAASLGVCLAPINPTLPMSAVDVAFRTAGIRHLIARKRFLQQCEEAGVTVEGLRICLDEEAEGLPSLSNLEAACDRLPEAPWVTGDETLLLTMTSGSTGDPKPIDLTQNIKHRRALTHIALYDITENDVVLAATPLYHSLAERLVIMPLILGATAVLMPRFTPNLWLQCVMERSVTFTIAVSAQLAQIEQLLSSPFAPHIDSLRCVVSSSALLEPHVRNALTEKLACQFHEMYGTSETSTVTDICFQKTPQKKRSVGLALPDTRIRIIRDDAGEAGPGETGEITCKTPLMCRGYWGMEDAMRAVMKDGYFYTGDMGWMDEDGYLYFSGRKKEIIITGGVNAYPQDIEACAMQLDAVMECAAFAYPDDRLGEVVALAIVPRPGMALDKRTVQIHCARNLADFQQPHRIFFVAQLPRNAMGKLMKNKLLEYVSLHSGDEKGRHGSS